MSQHSTVKLYTPGHGLMTDTLFMHGIVKVLSWLGVRDGKVRRVGEVFEVEIGHVTSRNVLERRDLIKALEAYIQALSSRADEEVEVAKLFKPVEKFDKIASFQPPPSRKRPPTKDKSVHIIWATMLINCLKNLDFNIIVKEYGKPHQCGGRKSGGGGKSTLYLPVGPQYGKYVSEKYEIKNKPYVSCSICITLSTLGLLSGCALVYYYKRVQGRGSHYFYYITVSPSEAKITDLLLFYRGVEELSIDISGYIKEPPLLAMILYALSRSESIYVFNNPVDILAWGITRQEGGSIRVIEFTRVHGNALLEAVARLKDRIPEWPRIADEIMANDPTVLQLVTESILFGTDVYVVAREYRRLAESVAKHERSLGRVMLEAGEAISQVLFSLR